MSDDKDLKALFGTMREQDIDSVEIPAFDDMISQRRSGSSKPWMYAAAAVAVALVGWFTLFQTPVDTGVAEDFDLSLDFIESEETDPLLADNPDMFDWEAATDILINDFDE